MRKDQWVTAVGLIVVGIVALGTLVRQERLRDHLEHQITSLESKIHRVDGTLPADAQVRTSQVSQAAQSTRSPDITGFSTSLEEWQRFKAAWQQAQRESKLEEQLNDLVAGWRWDDFKKRVRLDPQQADVLEPVFQREANHLKEARARHLTVDDSTVEDMQTKNREWAHAFYRQAKAHLKPSQLHAAKIYFGWPLDEKESLILQYWDWELLARSYKLDESVRAYFETALQQLHDVSDQNYDSPNRSTLLAHKEREIRQEVCKQIESHVSGDQLLNLKNHFGNLDSVK